MKGKAKARQKFCGNCGNHNAYNYPQKVFCSKRFSRDKDPIVQTLWCCEQWNPSSQECCCVEAAMKSTRRK